jgi:hypothetical protein
VYAAIEKLKSFAPWARFSRPSVGAVQLYQTLAPALPPLPGSPPSPVAPSVFPLIVASLPGIGCAATNMSFAGGGVVVRVRLNVPICARRPSTAIR